MPQTRAQSIHDALDLLGRGPGLGQDVPADDYAAVDRFIKPLVDRLRQDRIAIINADDVQDELYLTYIMMLANSCGPKFSVPYDDARQKALEQDMRRLTSGIPTYETLKVDYF